MSLELMIFLALITGVSFGIALGIWVGFAIEITDVDRENLP